MANEPVNGRSFSLFLSVISDLPIKKRRRRKERRGEAKRKKKTSLAPSVGTCAPRTPRLTALGLDVCSGHVMTHMDLVPSPHRSLRLRAGVSGPPWNRCPRPCFSRVLYLLLLSCHHQCPTGALGSLTGLPLVRAFVDGLVLCQDPVSVQADPVDSEPEQVSSMPTQERHSTLLCG